MERFWLGLGAKKDRKALTMGGYVDTDQGNLRKKKVGSRFFFLVLESYDLLLLLKE